MPSKRPSLANGEIYHIVIRAIEGLKLFRDERDYFRMIHDLFEFNDEASVGWQYRHRYLKQKFHGKTSRELLCFGSTVGFYFGILESDGIQRNY